MRWKHKLTALILSIGMVGHVAMAQQSGVLEVSFSDVELSEALVQLSASSGVNIVFAPEVVGSRRIDLEISGTVSSVLSQLLQGSGLLFRRKGNQYVVYRPQQPADLFVVSGFVEDRETGERLIAAHVYDLSSGVGSSTNDYGFFRLAIPDLDGRLQVSYLGYAPVVVEIDALLGETASIQLEKSLVLDTIIIYSHKRQQSREHPATPHLYPDEIDRKITLGGEFDLQSYTTRKPGVTTGTDGIGGINIRGGDNDQNLIMMDGVSLYSPTHAIGILSVFNPLLIREVELRKSDFPARYAGRLSSVLDVRTREGNIRKWSFQGSAGPLSANVVAEGPVVREKLSVLVAGRRFVPGFYLKDLSVDDKKQEGLEGFTRYSFDDLNAKITFVASDRDRLFLSLYHGKDRYSDLTEKMTPSPDDSLFETFHKKLRWGNTAGIFRWNRQFGARVFANATVMWSKFLLQSVDDRHFELRRVNTGVDLRGFDVREFKSSIKDIGARWDFDILTRRGHRTRLGAYVTFHDFRPKGISFTDQVERDGFVLDEGTLDDALFADLRIDAWDLGAYFEREISLSEDITGNLGLHLSAYGVRNTWYVFPQPRIRVRVSLTEDLTWETHANLMVQNTHLLTSSGIGLPTDLWVSSTPEIRPQEAYQVSTGFHYAMNDFLDLSLELYHKRLFNLTNYQEGASFLLEEGAVEASIVDAANWEEKVTQGTGEGYGAEVQAVFNGRRLQGSLSYTHAHATRTFPGINGGLEFPFRFDRRHSIAFDAAAQLNQWLRCSVGWTFGSGAPITLAESQFLYPGSTPDFPPIVILEFGDRNGYRLPPYHRLDIGLSATWQRPKARHSVHFNVYNVYNRKNILYVTLMRDAETQLYESKQFTVLPLIPSLSYHIKI